MEFRTEIIDSKLALAAIEAACLPWTRESRTRIRIGEGGHAVLDTTTGLVSGEAMRAPFPSEGPGSTRGAGFALA